MSIHRRSVLFKIENWKDKSFLFLRRGEFPLRVINLPSYLFRYYISGRAAMSIFVKSNLMSALQAFSLGGGWPRKAPRMPQDGRSPGGFIRARGGGEA